LSPTTKKEIHDRPLSCDEVINEGWMNRVEFDICAKASLKIFRCGQKIASDRGLILVDTKYEFGKDKNGNILLIDEVHTPDSSRYWLASTYEARMKDGLEPENIDKEFLRLWFVNNSDHNDDVLPDAPKDLVVDLSWRYITLCERITGERFQLDNSSEVSISDSIQSFLYLGSDNHE